MPQRHQDSKFVLYIFDFIVPSCLRGSKNFAKSRLIMPQLALNCHEFIKKEGLYGFCDCICLLRRKAQEQSIKPVLSEAEGAEVGLEVTANYAIYAHRTNYTRHATFCKCFFIGFFQLMMPTVLLVILAKAGIHAFKQQPT